MKKTIILFKGFILTIIFLFSFNNLTAAGECEPTLTANKYLIFPNASSEEETKDKTPIRMTILKRNISAGGFAGSERYRQDLVKITGLVNLPNFLNFKKFPLNHINSFEILTVICDDSNNNRVAFTVPFTAFTNFLYRGLAFHTGVLKSNNVIEGMSTFNSPIPSLALSESLNELSSEAPFIALPIMD